MSEAVVNEPSSGGAARWVARGALASSLIGFAMTRAYALALSSWSVALVDYYVAAAMTLCHLGLLLAAWLLARRSVWRAPTAAAVTLPALALALAVLTYVWVP